VTVTTKTASFLKAALATSSLSTTKTKTATIATTSVTI